MIRKGSTVPMKKLLSLFCTLSLSAALLAGCSGGNGNTNAAADGAESTSPTLTEPETTSQQETAAPVDVNVMALKGPTAMGMVEFMSQADTGELTDNNYHFSITAATDEVSAALAQGTTDLAAVPANLASVLYNNTEGGVQVLAINTLGVLYIVESGDTVHSVEDLRGKTIIGGRKGGVPEMTLEYVLRQHGLEPQKDVIVDTSVQFNMMAGAFTGGQGDYVTLFEPAATQVVTSGEGYILCSIGAESGAIPYTAYFASQSYTAEHDDVIAAFCRAIAKALDWVDSHTDREVAEAIIGQFPDTSLDTLEAVTARHREIGAWNTPLTMEKAALERLETVMTQAGELTDDQWVDFDKLVDNHWAAAAR